MSFDTDRTLLLAASLVYGAVLAHTFLSLSRGRSPGSGVRWWILAAGWVLQTAGLHHRGMAVHGCPTGNKFEILQFITWSLMLLYLVVGPAFRVSILGVFCSGLAAVLGLAAFAVPGWDGIHVSGMLGPNPWIELHAALALFSYGVFALLALTAGAHLAQRSILKGKHPGAWSRLLPSIVQLEEINSRLLLAGLGLLTVSLAVGSVFWLGHQESVASPKLYATLGVWGAYLAILILRWAGVLRARGLSIAAIALFVLALLTLFPVNASRPADAHPAPTAVP